MLKHAPQTTEETRRSLKWRVVDIAVGAAVGVMSGVMFWVFDGMSYGLFPLLTLILPGSAALLHALFYFPATLGLLIVRKPGASAYVLLVASFVEVVLGTKYSVSLVVIALVQALAAETVFAVFRYRRWTLGVTLLSSVAIGIVYNFYLLFFYYQAFSFFSPRGLIGTACELLSAAVFAGFGSWGLYRAWPSPESSHVSHPDSNNDSAARPDVRAGDYNVIRRFLSTGSIRRTSSSRSRFRSA